MPSGWRQRLISQQAAGTAFNTYTTAKTVINAQALWVAPAGYFQTIGRTLHVQALGALSNIVTTPGTITFQVMMGAVIAFTSGAIQLNATAHTLLPFRFDAWLTLRSVGATTAATFMGMGEVAGVQFTATAGQTDGANSQTILQVPATAPAAGTGWDSTVANIVDFWAGFSISNSGNGVTVHQYSIDDEGP